MVKTLCYIVTKNTINYFRNKTIFARRQGLGRNQGVSRVNELLAVKKKIVDK